MARLKPRSAVLANEGKTMTDILIMIVIAAVLIFPLAILDWLKG